MEVSFNLLHLSSEEAHLSQDLFGAIPERFLELSVRSPEASGSSTKWERKSLRQLGITTALQVLGSRALLAYASCPKTQTNSRLARRDVSIVIDLWRAPVLGRVGGDVGDSGSPHAQGKHRPATGCHALAETLDPGPPHLDQNVLVGYESPSPGLDSGDQRTVNPRLARGAYQPLKGAFRPPEAAAPPLGPILADNAFNPRRGTIFLVIRM